MKYIISGGGTGGHINPGIAIAREIKTREPDAEILFVGTENGLEGNLVPREGFNIGEDKHTNNPYGAPKQLP
jgi:UDP-N-acetylglucosamine--N-acetylmuramyl-(pentapeptide) pyrophosphoryl-undecaprenol N-acetylglucosamine transferase